MDRIYIGVLHVVLRIPGARTRKDRRQTVSSVRDRLRARFDVSVHEIGTSGDPQYQTLVCTTSGNDAKVLRTVLDSCAGAIHSHPVAEATQLDIDVFRWQPSEGDWAARMMAELSDEDEDDG